MNKKILSLLGVATVAVGMTTGATSTQASTLGPGVLSVETDGGIFFTNNAVDFTVDNTAQRSPNIDGTGVITTPRNFLDSQAGIFGVLPDDDTTFPGFITPEILDKLAGRQFVSRNLEIADFAITDSDGTPIFVENETPYALPEPFTFLELDTDNDGLFGEASGVGSNPLGDFKFIATTFRREVIPSDDPNALNVTFNFDGFFQDMEGNFRDTQAQFALFNGVVGVNPEDLEVTTLGAADDLFEFQAGGDGRIGTAQAPEPGTILGLTALAGLGLSSRLKRKAK